MSIAGSRVAQRFTLVRPLGRGAFSVVYLALDDAGSPYAVKIFPPELREHARHEAQMQLKSPFLGEVLFDCDFRGQAALVMQFVAGKPLFERYQVRPACQHEASAFLLTLSHVLSGLDVLHAAGILHRDIKPANILVSKTGQARVIDFDLSGPIGEVFARPRRIGTAAYQSPEAQRGDVLGTASDLYSLGVLLHWGLCGALPEPHLPGALCSELTLANTTGLTEPANLCAAQAAERLLKVCNGMLRPNPAERPLSPAIHAELQMASQECASGAAPNTN